MLARLLDTTQKRVIAGVVGLILVAGGAFALTQVGSDGPPPTTTTTVPLLTTTTTPPQIAPLTGLAGDYGEVLGRPALIVKVDNHELARPQAGLNQADVVIEERVEGNITRLAAIFHSQDADPVGPVRSTRSTDIDIAALFGRPLYASSGGNDHVLGELGRANVVDVGHNRSGEAFRRESGRRAPHNLFTTTLGLRAKAGETPPPPSPIFTYRTEDATVATGERTAAGVALSFGGAEVSRFTWDASSKTWLRSQSGTPHVDAAGEQIAPRNVVVLEILYTRGSSTQSSPHGVSTGEGRALVFTAGNVIEGRWNRLDSNSPLLLLAPDGAPILLTPGQTFLELPPVGGAVIL